MARSGGFEPPTAWFVVRYSIQLSYSRLSVSFWPILVPVLRDKGRNGGEGGIRTLDTRNYVWLLSRELVSATHPPLRDNGAYTTIIFLIS